MTNRDPSPATCLAAILATEPNPGGGAPLGNPYMRAARDAESLVRLGKSASRIAVQACNGVMRYDPKARQTVATWTEDDESKAEKARERIANSATEILQRYHATLETVSGDPRGFCLKFRLESGRSNSFGGEVWGV